MILLQIRRVLISVPIDKGVQSRIVKQTGSAISKIPGPHAHGAHAWELGLSIRQLSRHANISSLSVCLCFAFQPLLSFPPWLLQQRLPLSLYCLHDGIRLLQCLADGVITRLEVMDLLKRGFLPLAVVVYSRFSVPVG